MFDIWYGPAVWEQRPSARVKRLSDATMKITRFAEPVFDPQRNTVDVRYAIHCVSVKDSTHREFRESHLMRFFFLPELELLLGDAGFKIRRVEEWLTGKDPSPSTWSVTFVAQKC